jgi:hypothetical protein
MSFPHAREARFFEKTVIVFEKRLSVIIQISTIDVPDFADQA